MNIEIIQNNSTKLKSEYLYVSKIIITYLDKLEQHTCKYILFVYKTKAKHFNKIDAFGLTCLIISMSNILVDVDHEI